MFNRLKNYKDLFLVFVWREFTIRYRQSIIGIFWAILQPISMMLLFTFIFGVILKHKLTSYPYLLFFYSGVLPWNLFSNSMNFAISSLVNHRNLITKIYFPKEIIPLSGIALSLIDFAIGFVIYLILLVIYGIDLSANFLWFFPLMMLLLIFTVSLSLLFSAINVYYRDVKLLSGFLLQLWFFATPIIYSIDKVSLKWKILLFFNPLTFIIENIRRVTLEGRGVVLWQFLFEVLIIGIFYYFCYKIFLSIERKMADVI